MDLLRRSHLQHVPRPASLDDVRPVFAPFAILGPDRRPEYRMRQFGRIRHGDMIPNGIVGRDLVQVAALPGAQMAFIPAWPPSARRFAEVNISKCTRADLE